MFHCKISVFSTWFMFVPTWHFCSNLIFLNVQLPDFLMSGCLQQIILYGNTIFWHVNMHSYNLCAGANHLTKFLVLDSTSRLASYFLTFGFETVIDIDQYTGLVPCVLAFCLQHVYIVLRLLIVVLSVQLICLVCIYIIYCFSHFNTVTVFSTFCFSAT